MFILPICGLIYAEGQNSVRLSRNRYKELSRYVRFDDKNAREERKQKDIFAAIRELYEEFNEQCRANWELSDQITIDETLRRYRGRVAFKVYNSDKPAKYGILFRVLIDDVYRYVHRMIPYAGAPKRPRSSSCCKKYEYCSRSCRTIT